MRIPKKLRHNWKESQRIVGIPIEVCTYCGQRTANSPLYKNEVCPKRDRRKGKDRRRHRD